MAALPPKPAVCFGVCLSVSACVCVPPQRSQRAQTLSDGGMEGTSAGRWKTAVRFHTSSLSLCLSLSTYTLFTFPLHSNPRHLHICPNLMPSLPAEYTMMPFRQQPLRSFKPTGVTHKHWLTCARTHTACSDPDHWAESTFQLFITTLLQHKGAVRQRD